MRNNQAGYLLLICVFIMVAVSFIGLAAVYMATGSSTATMNFLLADQALYVAEGGLEKASRYILTPLLTGALTRDTCAQISGDTDLTNSSLGLGTFTVTSVTGAHYLINSKLTSAITATATTIPLTSTTGFAPMGRIQIDYEVITYLGVSGNSLTGALRGKGFSLASSHANGAYASQYQCLLQSQGGIPNLIASRSTMTIEKPVQLQDGWAAGVVSGNNFTFTHWNNPTELAWTNSSVTDATHKNTILGMTMLSNAEGWAVGTINGTTFNIVHYLNGTWTAYSSLNATCNTQTLNAVSAVSSQEAWAVGNTYKQTACSSGNPGLTVLRWNGTAWAALTSATSPSVPTFASTNQSLNDVKVLDTSGNGLGDIGFAVGAAGFILQYNGTTWTKVTSPTTQALSGVFLVSTSEAWAVGAAGVIIRWNGTSWSTFTSPTGTALNSIKMIDSNGNGTADMGCAVGNTGVVLIYNGTSWATHNPGGGNLFDCLIYSVNDIWAVGAAGLVEHWNGSAWATGSSGVTTQLNSAAKIYPRANPRGDWYQVFA